MKLTEVPKNCDSCLKPYGTAGMERRFQTKAILIFWLAAMICVPWALALWFILPYCLPPGRIIVPRIALAMLLVVIGAPSYFIALWGWNLPKVVRRMCWHCKTTRDFLVDNRG